MKNLIIFILLIQFFESHSQQKIEISYIENQDNSVSFNYKKNVSGSYLVVLDFSNLSNTREQRRINKIVQNKSGSILKLKPINKENRIGFNYKYIYYSGNINSKINKEYPYILPFKKGEKDKLAYCKNIVKKEVLTPTKISRSLSTYDNIIKDDTEIHDLKYMEKAINKIILIRENRDDLFN